jgi:hypothetical protein
MKSMSPPNRRARPSASSWPPTPDNPPQAVLAALARNSVSRTPISRGYVHKDKGKVLDLHFQKDGTDLFKGWKTEECASQPGGAGCACSAMSASVTPRVMSLAEAYA